MVVRRHSLFEGVFLPELVIQMMGIVKHFITFIGTSP